jgi:polysaccharide pyruvyl transferase WcaK-like protein
MRSKQANSQNKSFFIFGYFGWSNAGDDAIGYSVLNELFQRYPNANFVITCQDHYFIDFLNKKIRYLKIFPVKFDIFTLLKEIVQNQHFIITGGTHFHDQDNIQFRRLKIMIGFIFLTCFAKIFKKSPILLGHGIGPISHIWSKIMLKMILFNCKQIFVRDNDSYELLKQIGFEEKSILGFDCGAILANKISSHQQNQTKYKILGISLLPVYSIYTKDPEKDLLSELYYSRCFNSILTKNHSIRLRLFAFRSGNYHSDIEHLMRIMQRIDLNSQKIDIVVYDGDIFKILNKINECDYFIGMRYHASLFAYLMGKPLIICDYMGKCKSLAMDIGVFPSATVSLCEIEKEKFCEKILALLKNPTDFYAKIPICESIKSTKRMFETLGDIYDKSP